MDIESYGEGSNFVPIEGGMDLVRDKLVDLENSGVNPSDICVVTPYNKFLGELNEYYQDIFNPVSRRKINKEMWGKGDRVMALKNDYEVGVMNGECGILKKFNHSSVVIEFRSGDKQIKYRSKNGFFML